MHPKIFKRRGAVISEQFAQVDREIKAVCISLAQRVRLAGLLCIGDAEARDIEKQFQSSVDYIVRIPAASEEGRLARRELIRKLIQLEDYLESLLNSDWARSKLNVGHRQDLDQCRENLDRLEIRESR